MNTQFIVKERCQCSQINSQQNNFLCSDEYIQTDLKRMKQNLTQHIFQGESSVLYAEIGEERDFHGIVVDYQIVRLFVPAVLRPVLLLVSCNKISNPNVLALAANLLATLLTPIFYNIFGGHYKSIFVGPLIPLFNPKYLLI